MHGGGTLDNTSLIINKIKKLLALANSANEHEAALAARHAQRLLSEHNLAMADIEPDTRPESADTVEITATKTLPKWVRHLSAVVGDVFDCKVVHHPTDGTITFIGVGDDVQVAAYTFSYLDKTVRRLCGNYMKSRDTGKISSRGREVMRQSYYLGAVSTITGRLREQKIATPVTPGALVPVKEGLIRKAMSEMGPIRTVRSRRSSVDSDSYAKGQQDGQQIGINKGISGDAPQKVISGVKS